MQPLIWVGFALVISLVLRGAGDYLQHFYGPAWPAITLAILMLVHGMAGVASWTARYHGFGQRLLWLVAIHLHTLTYALNWPVYQGLLGQTPLMMSILPNLAAVGVIVAPSLLMYGGPVATVVQGSRRGDE